MALLVDKYRPRSLESLSYHDDLSARLKSLVFKLSGNSSLAAKIRVNRLKAETSHIFLYMGPVEQARSIFSSYIFVRRLIGFQNPHSSNVERTLWTRCRENKDRLSHVPNHVQSKT